MSTQHVLKILTIAFICTICATLLGHATGTTTPEKFKATNKDLTGAGLVVQMRFEALCKRALTHDTACVQAIRDLINLMNNPDYQLSSKSQQILLEYHLISSDGEVNIIMYKIITMPHILACVEEILNK